MLEEQSPEIAVQITPTTSDLEFTSSNLSFTSATPSSPQLNPSPPLSADYAQVPPSAQTSKLFSYNGSFGWLLEVEEDADEEQLPLLEELDIDLKDIAYKLRCALVPINVNKELLLESPDFWGPMAIVLLYSLLLIWGQFKVVSWVMTMWLVGSFLVFVLARVLGGDVTFSTSLGILGYSLLPLAITAAILPFVSAATAASWSLRVVGTLWAAYSASSVLITPEIAHRKFLLAYPIFLLYVYFMSLQSGV
eukprot:TRINITY_DN13344_c0_g1_i1.p1 TRINITY_DN13344_c0_g1~~TRINITY_DN13344_c0_g1_i1.p1  ORF type:complete len:250 (-),score=81.31 TRINITY_DN13344_c0_g1_i1:70-819(-)